MELFEDLEFKPLTEGLGFHRNAPETAKTPTPPQAKTPPPTFPQPQKPAFVPSLKPEYSFLDEESMNETKKFAQELSKPNVYQPIGRKEYSVAPAKTLEPNAKKASFSVPIPGAPASLSALQNQMPSLSTPMQTPKPMAKPLQPKISTASTLNMPKLRNITMASCMPAAILDGAFALGLSLILLVGVLVMTRVDLMGLLQNSQTDRFTQIQLGILFFVVLQMYTLVSRSTLFGQTIGEWAYDVQLGTDDQKKSALYPIQVIWRGFVFAITGYILLPIFSEFFGRDLAAALTGVELQKISHEPK